MTKAMKYSERLLVYHTGSVEAATMGMIKLTPIFLFFFGTLLAAPAFLASPDHPSWVAPLGKNVRTLAS